jgi:hypothetical protein
MKRPPDTEVAGRQPNDERQRTMSGIPDQSVGATLNADQRAGLSRIVEQFRQTPHGDFSQFEARVNVLWGMYLMIIHDEAEAADDIKKVVKKGSLVSQRRQAVRSLKRHLGRTPAVEDLVSSFEPDIKIPDVIREVVRQDLEQLQQRAPRRSRSAIIARDLQRIAERLSKSTKAAKAHKKSAKKRTSKK